MAIRAKVVLAAQLAVTTTADAYMTTMSTKIQTDRQMARLRLAIEIIQGKPAALKIFKLAMLDGPINLRAWIVLDFKDHVNAHCIYALGRVPPVNLDPLKYIQRFCIDAEMFQAKIAQAEVKNCTQGRKFIIEKNGPKTIKALVLPSDWVAAFQEKRASV
ncbi:hypothetical protein BP6252_04837 [Coleophoma cylindrospora]|uniref:Uncharacterized protein n=1 Tax=Coleophoma cylindrospora TaxID=1849047 RepID=A0A3D8S1M7_9HELO|nr:hypothetical protein BP6252_04837 [Coleophoma cylindrospora]